MAEPAKSARLQLLQGNPNRRTKEELNKRAEQEKKMNMSAENVKPPAWLDTNGKKEFKRLAKLLTEVELVNDADVAHLAVYCDSYSQYLNFKKQVEENGMWIGEKPNPFILRMKDAAAQMRSYGSDLGLSPSARAKLAINLGDDKNDEDDDF